MAEPCGNLYNMECFPVAEGTRMGIAARDGFIWTTTNVEDVVLKFDNSGNLRARISVSEYPFDLAETSDGTIIALVHEEWIAKYPLTVAVSVAKYDKNGKFLVKKSIVRYPTSIITDVSNNVWITCLSDNLVIKVDSNGDQIAEFPSGGLNPEEILADPTDGVWILNHGSSSGESGNLVHLSASGKQLASFVIKDVVDIESINMDLEGSFWLVRGFQVRYEYEYYSTITRILYTGEFKDSYTVSNRFVCKVIPDQNGNIWATAIYMHSLVKFRPLELTSSFDLPQFSVVKEDVDGNLWILSTKEKILRRLTRDGTQLVQLSISLVFDIKANPGNFFLDDRSGHIWISQYSAGSGIGSVLKLTYSGQIVGNFEVGKDPRHLLLDITGNIYVDCTHAGGEKAIWKLTPNGQFVSKLFLPSTFDFVVSMAADRKNNLIVLIDDRQILKYNPSGNLTSTFPVPASGFDPVSMVLDDNKTAWILLRDHSSEIRSRIQRIHIESGEFLANFLMGFKPSQGIWVMDNEGKFWVDDELGHIIRVNQTGVIIGKHSINGFGRPLGISIDNQNNVWLTTTDQANKLLRLSATPVVPSGSPTASKSPVGVPATSAPSESTLGKSSSFNGDLSGLRGFLAIFILSILAAVVLSLLEYQRLRESRLFLAAIRMRDRLLFRLRTKQSSARAHVEMPTAVSLLFLDLVRAQSQYEVLLTEVTIRSHIDKAEMERAVRAAQLALFALVFSYNMPGQLSTNKQDPDYLPPGSPQEGDYLAITNASQTPPSETVNLVEATNKVVSAVANLIEGTEGKYIGAKVKQAEQDAISALQSVRRYSLDPSTSASDVLRETTENAESEWRENGPKYKKAFRQYIGFLPRFSVGKGGRSKTQVLRSWFPRLVQFPGFYGLFIIFIVTIFLSFAAKVDRTNASLDANNRVPLGLFVGNLPFLLGGYGQTFIFVPPQYNLSASAEQASGVPVLYGVMHCVLFFLGLLPVPFMRGFWRDAVQKYPILRKYLPIDDFTYFHRLCAWLALSGLLLGCLIWLVTLGIECGIQENSQSCLAFDVSNSNPVDNVLVLRFIVWVFWFPIMPLMYYVRRGPWQWMPNAIKRFYFETVYVLHLLTAFFTVLLALICRFTIFYPVLLSWIPYFLDWFREVVFHTHKVSVNESEVKWFSSIHDQKPTSVRLSFKHSVTRQNFGAGQWMYLMIPSIDYNWHPFSIASASKDQDIELHIGVIAPGIKNDAEKKTWMMPRGTETWTFRLWQLIRKPQSLRRFDALIRGPYGTAFSSCFDPKYDASVVIGAGTGLTAAESVLRETIWRRKSKLDTPPFTWFIWSCRRVDDMMWCWDTLVDLIYDCTQTGVLDIELISNRPSDAMNVFDWLGVALFVTQATEDQLKEFVSYRTNLRTLEHQRIEEWLFNQIVAGALDDEDTHVRKLLQGVHQKLVVSGYLQPKVTVAYCGPSALATTISAAAQEVDGNIEFSSDNQ